MIGLNLGKLMITISEKDLKTAIRASIQDLLIPNPDDKSTEAGSVYDLVDDIIKRIKE